MTSTGGTLPSRRSRLGRKPTIQPSTGGMRSLRSSAMLFWPGAILIGPNLNLSVCTPSCAAAGEASVEQQEDDAEREAADLHDSASIVVQSASST